MSLLNINKKLMFMGVIAVLSLMIMPVTAATIIPDDVGGSNPFFVSVANDEGASADLYGNDTYAMCFHGGGYGMSFETDSLYDAEDDQGVNLLRDSGEGSFYLNFYGGRGGVQKVILMLAVNGTLSDDFRAHFRTSGYKIDYNPTLAGRLGALTPDDITYVSQGIDETFTKDDLIYGPQITRPPSGSKIYHSQDLTDTDDTFQIMFIDTNLGIVGNRGHGDLSNEDLTDTGRLKVDYSFENLGDSMAVVDAYGWLYSGSDSAEDVDPSISWTNPGSGDGELRILIDDTSAKEEFGPLPHYNKIYVKPANDEGIAFDNFNNGTYYMNPLPGDGQTGARGGLNAVHISKDPTTMGQYTFTSNQTGVFYATDFGGRGYQDDVILMLAVNGTVPEDFEVHVKASGYNWTPGKTQNGAPAIEDITYQPLSLDETFTRDDLVYGPQNWKPTGTCPDYPIIAGQDMSDPENQFRLMFIDTHAGMLGAFYGNGDPEELIDHGAVRVEYSFRNLESAAAFNIYAWNEATSHSSGMSWTNSVLPGNRGGLSGYAVFGGSLLPPAAPVVAFTMNGTSGTAPLTVQFTDTSAGGACEWAWDFGDDSVSDLQNPVHTYSEVGDYNVTLTATNIAGSNSITRTGCINVRNIGNIPLPDNRNINIEVANDAGVKFDVPDGITAGGFPYKYVNNTYFVLFRNVGGGLNPMDISVDPAEKYGQFTNTDEQSGTFWVTFHGGQGHMDDGILMLAVNGTVSDDFSVNIRSAGYNWTPAAPDVGNVPDPENPDYQDEALNETFDKSDFIYGPQIWRPASLPDYPVYGGQAMDDTENTFSLMFIDLGAGALRDGIDSGSIKVDYSFHNLTTFAAFNSYGWYSASNHGTGIIMTNSGSGYTVNGFIPPTEPVADFSADVTSGGAPLTVQFTDSSAGDANGWAWDFDNDGVTDSTEQNPEYTYTAMGKYSVRLTVMNEAGTDSILKEDYITVHGVENTRKEISVINTGRFTDLGDGKRQYSVKKSEAEIEGNNIVMRDGNYTLTLKSGDTPSEEGDNYVSDITGIELATSPVRGVLNEVGNVAGSLDLLLNDLPENSALKITLERGDSGMGTAFQFAARDKDLGVSDVAYTMNVIKTNLTNGQEIKDATITMICPAAWVNANGGSSAIKIIRLAEDGTKEVLETTCTGTDGDMMTFEGYSPNGLSMFGLTSVTEQKIPLPRAASGGSGGGKSNLGISSLEDVPAGDMVYLKFDNTGITEIDLYAKENIEKILITTENGKMPEGAGTPEGEIYEYVKILAYHAPESSIEKLRFRFEVPRDWVDSRLSSPDQISLYQYNEESRKWVLLSTVFEKEVNGSYEYFAESASTGSVAIAAMPDLSSKATPVSGSDPVQTPPTQAGTLPDETTPATDAEPTANSVPLFGGITIVFAVFAAFCVIALANRRFS